MIYKGVHISDRYETDENFIKLSKLYPDIWYKFLTLAAVRSKLIIARRNNNHANIILLMNREASLVSQLSSIADISVDDFDTDSTAHLIVEKLEKES